MPVSYAPHRCGDYLEDGKLQRTGKVDMTRTALEGFGKKLRPDDEVVIEATGRCMAVSGVLSPFVAMVIAVRCR